MPVLSGLRAISDGVVDENCLGIEKQTGQSSLLKKHFSFLRKNNIWNTNNQGLRELDQDVAWVQLLEPYQ